MSATASQNLSNGQIPFIPDKLADDLLVGKSREVLILFDDTTIRQESEARTDIRAKTPRERISLRASRYRILKRDVFASLPATDATLLRDYSQLPLSLAKIHGQQGLNWLRSRQGIRAVYENNPIYYTLNESLPFIQQPEVTEAGFTGEGVAVAIIDTGVVYTNAAFGPCTSPGTPASCRVAASIDIAADDVLLDEQGHGTNVSAIVAGVAPKADLVVLDIFEGNNSDTALLLESFNWVLTNHSTYNITTLNLSLGDGGWNPTSCGLWQYNPFLLPINDLRDIGITVVAASGNEGYTDGISMPACTPGVISVGAVYDTDVGSRSWTGCTDAASAADQVTCFSDSADYLSILAPGTLVTAGGYIATGTSQASPHVAGAAAVLAAAQPLFSPDEIAHRLTSTGDPVLDQRNNLQFPRLNLATALAPEIEASAVIEEAVPFLPDWALLTLITVLLLSGIRKRKQQTACPR